MASSKGFVERVAERTETHVEEWRERDGLWDEALERKRRLVETAGRESRDREEDRRMVFVVHSEDSAARLEDLAARRARISGVVPEEKNADGMPGTRGSWLVFDEPL